MSNDTNNGGPAFPLPVEDLQCRSRFESSYGGMSLRDYFAAKAMQGLLAARGHYENYREIASDAYLLADAMLRKRETIND